MRVDVINALLGQKGFKINIVDDFGSGYSSQQLPIFCFDIIKFDRSICKQVIKIPIKENWGYKVTD